MKSTQTIIYYRMEEFMVILTKLLTLSWSQRFLLVAVWASLLNSNLDWIDYYNIKYYSIQVNSWTVLWINKHICLYCHAKASNIISAIVKYNYPKLRKNRQDYAEVIDTWGPVSNDFTWKVVVIQFLILTCTRHYSCLKRSIMFLFQVRLISCKRV